ncbi:MAG: DUF481 domain-containing protein [Verrucomicrobia bacterium]|jgi:putative salt-induced outer membrane protein|nr:DUF481 domain-containing protein [Verrucomicrobiota bacterium]
MKVVSIAVAVVVGAAQLVVAADGEWDSTVAAGVNVTSGNSDTLAASGSVSGEKAGEDNEIRLGVEANFAESEVDGVDETTTDNAKAYLAYKYKFDRSYAYSDNSLATDDMADIKYRLIAGVGMGYRVIESDAIKLGLELGAAYMSEELAGDVSDDGILARIAARHDQALSETSKFWLSAEYLPRADDTDDYLLNGEAGVEAALNSTLSLRVVVQDRYDSTVPVDREHNDLAVISSLVYTL